jgi:hypothetical protein
MKTQPTPNHGYHRISLNSLTRIAAFVALVALIGIPLFSSSSASSSESDSRAKSLTANEGQSAVVGAHQRNQTADMLGMLRSGSFL